MCSLSKSNQCFLDTEALATESVKKKLQVHLENYMTKENNIIQQSTFGLAKMFVDSLKIR